MKERSQTQQILKRAELAIRRCFLFALKLSRGFKKQNAEEVQLHLQQLLQGSPSVLFLRQDRLGDAIITTPLLVALHAKYPNAKLLMLLGTNNVGIRELLPIGIETFVYRKQLVDDLKMLRTLRERDIDILIDLTDNASATSSLLVQRIKPKIAIGIEKENAVVYDLLVPRLDREEVHISRRIAELLRPLGIDPETVPLQPTLSLASSPKVPGRIGLNISAGASSRYAPASTYARLASMVANCSKTEEVRVLYGPTDLSYAQSIVAEANHPKVLVMPGTMTFAEFGSYISSCEILITPDTSVVHLAAAAGVPMVVIYAPIPDGLRYWTPTGVPFEMMIQRPSLATLEPDPVLALFQSLHNRLQTVGIQ